MKMLKSGASWNFCEHETICGEHRKAFEREQQEVYGEQESKD